ncbi:MAG: DNA-directed RNA polymerase subunit L [Thermoplasmata archaeon]|nr:DNA-directed RNA polymerase subunit L [Thermoplasmata archaeon]
MELKLLKKQKDMIQIELMNADDTLLYPLIHQLLLDDSVEDASYTSGHPRLDNAVLTVRVKDGKPQSALKKAARALASEYASAREIIEKKLG